MLAVLILLATLMLLWKFTRLANVLKIPWRPLLLVWTARVDDDKDIDDRAAPDDDYADISLGYLTISCDNHMNNPSAYIRAAYDDDVVVMSCCCCKRKEGPPS